MMEEEELKEWRDAVMSAKKVPIMREKEQYEYETIQILPGGLVYESDLNGLGKEGYRLVGVVPLTIVNQDIDGWPQYHSAGTSLIFERRKETD